VLKAIFTWWNGATIGAGFHIKRRGVLVGQDDYGNRYFEARDAKDSYDGRRRRWVIYKGYPDASKVPAEWHGWLHYTFDELPTPTSLPPEVLGKGSHSQHDGHDPRLAAQGLDHSRWRASARRRGLRGLAARIAWP
jgi:NADH:ubiquinone oxidoreductase subunit